MPDVPPGVPPFSLEKYADRLSEGKLSLAFSKTLLHFGFKHDYIEGDMVFPEAHDFGHMNRVVLSKEFVDHLEDEIKEFAFDLLMEDLVNAGTLTPNGINDDGTIRYIVNTDENTLDH